MPVNPTTNHTLPTLRRTLPEAAKHLHLELGDEFGHWIRTVDQKILPRMDPAHPLAVAICGGGSAGKSTLFNHLIGEPLSPMGGQAGLNRRVLVAAHEKRLEPEGYLQYIGQAFGNKPEPLRNKDQLLEPGPPLYCAGNQLPAKMVLMDTPDIDTGAQGVYSNRDMARQALEVADLFIYVFTNATYNNRDNTDFIAQMLTGMGSRPCYLVYRVYPNFSDKEIREHAHTVAQNIYGSQAEQLVLGLFRMNEDNAVAAGDQPLAVEPVGSRKSLLETLDALDTHSLRANLLGSMAADALDRALETAQTIHQAASNLGRYTEALRRAQAKAVQHVLSHFPADQVLRRFAHIWIKTDPAHIKWMRTTGRIVGWPLKMVTKTIRGMASSIRTAEKRSKKSAIGRQIEMDLLSAANQLYQQSLDTDLPDADGRVALPARLGSAQGRLSRQQWQEQLERLLSHKEEVLSWSLQLDADLTNLAKDLRERMGFFDQVRQTFAALLNVIPATVAVTYILHTGDPVGAAGIKVKLTGILGLHDLYALVAIPATAGISKADRRQLELLLQPLARTWLAHKYSVVQQLFETHITGELLTEATTVQEQLGPLMDEIEGALGTVQR